MFRFMSKCNLTSKCTELYSNVLFYLPLQGDFDDDISNAKVSVLKGIKLNLPN